MGFDGNDVQMWVHHSNKCTHMVKDADWEGGPEGGLEG